MLRSPKDLMGARLLAVDGEIGAVEDLLFDDRTGRIRYLAVGFVVSEEVRHVLLDPETVKAVDPEHGTVAVSLSREEVEAARGEDADPPVSWRKRSRWEYVTSAIPWCEGTGMQCLGVPVFALADRRDPRPDDAPGNPHLRSFDEVSTYSVRAVDGWGGTVVDLLVDLEAWTIRKILVRTRRWWPGRKVVFSWWWLRGISFEKRQVLAGMTRREIRECPKYDPFARWNTEYGVGVTG